MPLSPIGDWLVLAFLALVTVLLGFNHDTRIALYVTPVWIVGLAIGYLASRKHDIRLTPNIAAASKPTGDALPPHDDELLALEPQIALERPGAREPTTAPVNA